MKLSLLKNNNQKAYTLVELIVYIAMSGIFTMTVLQAYLTQTKIHKHQELLTSLNQELRTGINLMTKEIRMAGCDPLSTGLFGFKDDDDDRFNTDSDSIHFTSDIDEPADGKASGSKENVTYYLYPSKGSPKKLGRKTGSGYVQPVVENITELSFIYYDLNNDVIKNPSSSLDKIKSVKVTLSGQAYEADPLTNKLITMSVSSRIWVRNSGLFK